jgi:hypothetical protein
MTISKDFCGFQAVGLAMALFLHISISRSSSVAKAKVFLLTASPWDLSLSPKTCKSP